MTDLYRYERKIYKVGDSFVVTVPALWCKANQIKSKEKVWVELDKDRVVITKQKKDGNRRK